MLRRLILHFAESVAFSIWQADFVLMDVQSAVFYEVTIRIPALLTQLALMVLFSSGLDRKALD